MMEHSIVRWFWKDDESLWNPYTNELSEQIEVAYLAGATTLRLQSKPYELNLKRRIQTNVLSGFKRDLLRGTWFWLENNGTFQPFEEAIATRLEAAYQTRNFGSKIDHGDGNRYSIIELDGTGNQFTILIGSSRPIRRGYYLNLGPVLGRGGPIQAGYLEKQGRKTKKFYPRWVSLFKDCLVFCKTKGGPEKGRIWMYEIVKALMAPPNVKYNENNSLFCLFTKTRRYFFKAKYMSHAEEWIKDINMIKLPNSSIIDDLKPTIIVASKSTENSVQPSTVEVSPKKPIDPISSNPFLDHPDHQPIDPMPFPVIDVFYDIFPSNDGASQSAVPSIEQNQSLPSTNDSNFGFVGGRYFPVGVSSTPHLVENVYSGFNAQTNVGLFVQGNHLNIGVYNNAIDSFDPFATDEQPITQ
eukprot:TRINITY_DN11193_c0_g1_i1.p1 TRINITY_DN11193_c0_g1~~TRINITY_DN11193_c0_g1_i1.p1  ORF type:complete len:412 (-),score=102.42 TRINITY_DN11193_c0_g1_i1:49-1284(-)